MQKEAFEATGLIPRSIIRTFDRFLQQLLPGSENIAIREYRLSRYQIIVSIKSLFQLICIPLFVNYTVKSFLLAPLVEYLWDSRQEEIFINAYQEKRAFAELHDFSEKLFFDSLIESTDADTFFISSSLNINSKSQSSIPQEGDRVFTSHTRSTNDINEYFLIQDTALSTLYNDKTSSFDQNVLGLDMKKAFQLKSLEIATHYNKQSILAITNLLGDFITFFTIYLLFVVMKAQIIILKSFLTESIYSLSDTSKSFLLILGMDLLVGFHSPRAWEIALEAILRHLGLPENENFILLFVALFPVFLDTVFKYWIFRYLNKISPSTVVTYHSMLE